MQSIDFDVIVVGGGMVGAAIALGLSKQNFSVAVIEQHKPESFSHEQMPDMRLSAFNIHSVNLLKDLGAWQHIEQMRYREYDTLSVWEQADDITQFTAQSISQPRLGYFVENRLVQLGLYAAINASKKANVSFIFGNEIKHIDPLACAVELSDARQLKAKLLIGADGAHSQVRQACNIPCTGWQYAQQANAILVKMTKPIPNETWQAFTPSGPRALLPMHEQYACLVWYNDIKQSQWIRQASFKQLKPAIVEAFSDRLGDFDIVDVAGFGLTRMHAKHYGRFKAIILGDAAHTINPLAGQGVNLGFKDVSALLEIIADKGIEQHQELTHSFEHKRKLANLLMMSTMDALYFTFSTPTSPIKALRQAGLKLAQNAGGLKTYALKYAMGLEK